MNLFAMMETSGGAMQAERMRAEVVAANMANAETTKTAEGGPYKRQHVVFAANQPDGSFLDSMNSATGQQLGQIPVVGAQSFQESNYIAQLGGGKNSVVPGVHIAAVVEDQSPSLKRYDPGHPDADANGYVSYPDINPLTEMVDLMGATRAYGLNGSAVQAEKTMISSALDLAKNG
ncbi:flagellar basal body rod protein FlgC [Telmatobacter bradus]|uniref:flagellar basal body rod protein FlgC n=1 Tax=Telmatobacter bradus TaxID=474953 RepID=UPI003B43AB1E